MATSSPPGEEIALPAGSPGSKGARTRMAIVQSAIGRFVVDGFQRTSMADVARDVGLSPSAVYRYFPTKEALFIAAVDDDLAGVVDLVRRTLHGGAPTVSALLAAVRAELGSAVAEHPLAARALTGGEPMGPERIMALPHLADLRADIVGILQRGQRAGVVRPDLPAATLALGIETVVIYQLAHLASLRGVGVSPADERWDAIAAVIEAALQPCIEQPLALSRLSTAEAGTRSRPLSPRRTRGG